MAAATACGVLAFSYGYWWYSVEVEVYILSTLLLILTLAAAWHAALAPAPRRFAVCGAANGLAVLGHNTNVLFAAVALAALVFAWRALPRREALRCGLAYVAAAIATVLPLYLLAFAAAGLESPRQIADWLTGYARQGTWGHLTAANAPKAIVGAGRALIGGHFALSLESIAGVAGRMPGMALREKLYLVRGYSPALAAVLLVASCIAVLGMLVLAAAWLRRPALGRGERTLAALCLVWLAVYTPFFFWWDPSNIEFWIAVWVPLSILLALPLARSAGLGPSVWPPVAATVVAALFAVNLLGSVLPQRDAARDYWRTRVAWYEQHAAPADTVLATGYVWSNYLSYYTGAAVVNAHEAFLRHGDDRDAAVDELRRRLEGTSGRVLVSSEALWPEPESDTACGAADPDCLDAEALRTALLPHARLVHDGPMEQVWQLAP
jgi:hypothetical protein